MAYIGQSPFQEFTNPPTKDSFTGDGSTTTFDLDQEVPSASQNALEVYVDNVRQEPGTGKAFTLGVDGSGDSKRITFSAAPANGASIYVINDKTNSTIVAPLSNDLNGTELILDVDGDTSITADTDDRIDFKIANVEHFSFSNSSGDTVIKPMVDAKDILFQQYDGRTLLDINDGGYIAIANGATGPGQLRLYEDTDNGTNFTAFQVGTQSGDITYTLPTADGSSGQFLTTNGSGVLSFDTVSSAADDISTGDAAVTIATSSGDITLDSPADIILDAAGNDFNFKAGGTEVLRVTNSSSDVIIKPIVDAKDLIFQQRDGTEVMRIEDGAHVAFTAAALNPEATLSDGANVAWNTLTSPVAKVTLAGNRNLSAGSGGVAGAFQSLLVIQDGTGSRTLSFNAVYEFKDDTAPTLTSTANKGDLFVFRYNGSKFLEVGRNQNLTLS